MKAIPSKRFFLLITALLLTLQPFAQISVDLKVILEGPFGGAEMETSLNSFGLIPLTQPYNAAPWNYSGPESIIAIPNSEVVDWILVELRETAGDASTAYVESVVGRQAGFVLKNGTITGIDGISPMQFGLTISQKLFVVVYHRNHLAVMSAVELTGTGGQYGYNFTAGVLQAFGGATAHKELVPGIWGMVSGDGNGDGQVNNGDKNDVWKQQAGFSGYFAGDFTMNGQVDNVDKIDHWLVNSGRSAQLPGVWVCGKDIADVRDGHIYTTVEIGNRCWMGENLNAGTRIDGVQPQSDNGTIEKYCYNNSEANCDIYGGLYQWNEMMQYVSAPGAQGICLPNSGWHVPTDEEWKELEGEADSQYGYPDPVWDQTGWRGLDAGGNMKETGTIHWASPNTGATNLSGFTALPGGDRNYSNGSFNYMSTNGYWWCSTETGGNAVYRTLGNILIQSCRDNRNKAYGYSVRCIANEPLNNLPPSSPENPVPFNGSTAIGIDPTLSWTCSDPNGDALHYSIYFGDSGNPQLMIANHPDTFYYPGTLNYSTAYSWKVVAYDVYGDSTAGPVWDFITKDYVWSCGDTIVDPRDGKVYNTTVIGTQCWMAANLNIGARINGVQQQADNGIIEKYCYNNSDANCDVYGGLYQWNEIMNYVITQGVQGICPPNGGWHVPTDAEWCMLEQFVDNTIACDITGWRGVDGGGKLKETGFTHWTNPNAGSSDLVGFTALPGGGRNYLSGSFNYMASNGYWWSSTESGDSAVYRTLGFSLAQAARDARNKNYGYSVRCVRDNPETWKCGDELQVVHTAGDVAPVSKLVNYQTSPTNLAGTNRCWITQNLGSDQQATSATDDTEASAGWYWQFNRKQGYMHDGLTRTPNTIWITSIIENANWWPSHDPCALLLGSGWRMPTYSEWYNADLNGGWNNYSQAFTSALKLHAAGQLWMWNGGLMDRGSIGYYWTDNSNTLLEGLGSILHMYNYACGMTYIEKANGNSVRCVRDIPTSVSCGDSFQVVHYAGEVSPVNKTVTYGTVETNLSGSNKCWITQNLGADHQAASATDATEASAGWYWQFGKIQGYKHDGTTLIPGNWNPVGSNYTDWQSANDPCTKLFGEGWRIPTGTEWSNADLNGGWNNYDDSYSSVLKLHAAGYIQGSAGTLLARGSNGHYWSSTSTGLPSWALYLSDNSSTMQQQATSLGYSIRCLIEASWSCGNDLQVVHTAGDVAPVDKTINYGTVVTNLTGSDLCWITQNLGADHQANSATDDSEASAGWYWQFNRRQGYKHDGTIRTPNTPWIMSINENSNWQPGTDPCKALLGSGWRIPTQTEWTNADINGGWNNHFQAYSSELTLHSAGYLHISNGQLLYRGSQGAYWSSTQEDSNKAWHLFLSGDFSSLYFGEKAWGTSVRCVYEPTAP
ncbi:MAG: hypothetical protein JXA03_02485 [Bacteroidales bacterium]|nr:hypothetical protein [Bacteroidales bacterium]